jgi:predicted Zn-dependent protease
MSRLLDPAAIRACLKEISFLEGVLRRCPGHRMALEALGDLYTRTGRYESGLNADLELVAACPDDPTIRYNLACDLALLGRREEAIAALSEAVRLGYADFNWMKKDDDLASLRKDPQFLALVSRRNSPAQGKK